VGHVQRVFEAAGLPTVGIYIAAFAHVPEGMGVARALITEHPLGRPVGAPGDADRQRAVVSAALELLTSNDATTIRRFPEPYRTFNR
jgi:hypothetical protein